MQLAIGARFDRYTIEGLLGEGGMGEVYRAYDPRLRRNLALKILRTNTATSQAQNARSDGELMLMREARAAAALDHPNAVAIFDVGEVEGRPFIAMELIEGDSLRRFVGASHISWERKVRWLVEVGRVLAAAHDRGLVHRDVKPENVIVRADGVAKVLDFGIAKQLTTRMTGVGAMHVWRAIEARAEASLEAARAPTPSDGTGPSDPLRARIDDADLEANLDDDDRALTRRLGDIVDSATTRTATGLILGTPRYLSPEQVRGVPIDGRADQFSWGIVAYELLTGELPFHAAASSPESSTSRDREARALLAMLRTTPPCPSQSCHELPASVDDVVLRALEKDPSARFASMHDLVDALEGAVPASTTGSIRVRAAQRVDLTTSLPTPLPTPLPISATTRSRSSDVSGVHTQVSPSLRIALEGHEQAPRDERPSRPSAAPSTVRPQRPRGLVGSAIGLAAILGAGAFIAIGRTSVGHRPSMIIAPTSTPSALASDGRTSATTGPTVPPATDALHAGLQSLRDADFAAAEQSFDRAVDLDPGLAAAHLRLAVLHSMMSAADVRARRSFKSATLHRATLDATDARLLEAMAPRFDQEPPDLVESERRLTVLQAAQPTNDEIAFYLGQARYDRGALPEALQAFNDAIAIDPRFAAAWSMRAGVQAYLGQFDDALTSVKRCLDAVPSATECLWNRILIEQQSGDCDKLDHDVRDWLAKDPEDAYAHGVQAQAFASLDRPRATIAAALQQRWSRLTGDERVTTEAIDSMHLDLLFGDFDAVIARGEQALRDEAGHPALLSHAAPTALLVQAYIEAGRTAEATRVARAFIEESDAWVPPHRVDDLAIQEDPTPTLLGVLAQSGALPMATLATKRDAWLHAWRGRTANGYVSFLWVWGWAATAIDATTARQAIAALRDFPPIAPFMPQSPGLAHVGHAYLLAGDASTARGYLERATHACIALDSPVEQTRALYDLASSRERVDDRDAACALYDRVLSRWGAAKPMSITARAAMRRRRAIGCK